MKEACSVGAVAVFPEGSASAVRVAEVEVVVFRRGARFHAFVNCCPHQGRALDYVAGKFLLTDDDRLVCPAHGATFAVDSGHCLTGPCAGACLTPVPAVVEDGELWLGPVHD